jgi:uroporphyrinogen III methyltransferase/synthase
MRKKYLPLSGITVIVTRPEKQADEFSLLLRRYGARVAKLPVVEIAANSSAAKVLSNLVKRNTWNFDWAIFTSANGVRAFFAAAGASEARQLLNRCRVAAIGEKTAQVLCQKGVRVHLVPPQFVAESLVSRLAIKGVCGKRVIILRSEQARDTLPVSLRNLGAEVRVVNLYRTVLLESDNVRVKVRKLLASGGKKIVTFTSSSTAKNFVRLAGGKKSVRKISGAFIASIGPVTSGTARRLGLPVHIEAKKYTIEGLTEAIVRKVSEMRRSKRWDSQQSD